MTVEEWLACEDPERMLKSLQGKASERKLRLFACACARLLWGRLPAALVERAVEAGERHADGAAWRDECQRLTSELHTFPVEQARETGRNWFSDQPGAVPALFAAIHAVGAWLGVAKIPDRRGWEEASKATGSRQPALLRDIFRCPGGEAALDRPWRTPAVAALAAAAYEERDLPSGELDTSRLSAVADALEDAGCSDPDLLGHLRSPGPHVRGCWALDLVLGKG
jgi:hypothetical protein